MTIRLKDNLRRLLMARGIRASDFARQTGVAPSVLSEWMAGRMPRNLSTLRNVAQHLQVSLDELCFEETEKLLQRERSERQRRSASAKEAVPVAKSPNTLEELRALFPITLRLRSGEEVTVELSGRAREPESPDPLTPASIQVGG